MQKLSRLLLIASSLMLTACAFGTRNATLMYPPKSDSSQTVASQPIIDQSKKATLIVLNRFSDQRTDKKVVGTVRNGYGMRTADVVPTNPVEEWVTQAIKTELQNYGYTVVDATTEEQSSPESAVIKGDVINVFCDMYLTYEGHVTFLAKVYKDGHEIMSKPFSGDGTAGMAWAATGESYAQSLSLSLADAIKKFIAELNTQLISK